MATLNILVRRRPEQVWKVLADGWSYAEWVAGTRAILSVDDDWPAVGASLQYTAGLGRFTLEDRTTVRISRPPEELQMEAHAGWIGTARIAIEVLPWGDGSVVIFDEHPLRGQGARWHNAVVEVGLRSRNRFMLRRFAEVVENRT